MTRNNFFARGSFIPLPPAALCARIPFSFSFEEEEIIIHRAFSGRKKKPANIEGAIMKLGRCGFRRCLDCGCTVYRTGEKLSRKLQPSQKRGLLHCKMSPIDKFHTLFCRLGSPHCTNYVLLSSLCSRSMQARRENFFLPVAPLLSLSLSLSYFPPFFFCGEADRSRNAPCCPSCCYCCCCWGWE